VLPFWRRRAFWTGAAIFAAAAALRLSLVETARFTGDEARDYALGMQMVHEGRFPLLGPIITNGPAQLPGPLSNWLAAFPQLFTRAPEAGNVFFELLGAASVWMFWFALRRPFGEAPAAFAAALLAFSPWSALFGDRVWNPNAFLAFATLAMLAAVKLRERPGSAWVAVLLVACLILPQLHMSAPVVWLALVPFIWGTVRRWNRRWLALGLVVAALLYIPLAIHEAKTGFGNTRAFLAESLGGHKKTSAMNFSFLLSPFYVLRFLTLDVTYHELSGYWGGLNEAAAWHALWYGSPARPFHPLRLVALLASGGLLVLSLGAAVRAALARRGEAGAADVPAAPERPSLRPFALAALLAVVGDVVLLALTSKQVFAHYVTPTLPFVFVVFAAGARATFGHRPPKIAMLALAAIVAAGGIEATLSISRRIDGRNGLAVHRTVAQRLIDDCAAEGRPLAACPARLDFGFTALIYTHAIFAHTALSAPIRWDQGAGGYAYRLLKRDDPPPPGAAAFTITRVGPVALYRLK
jgi:Dolichyl-phosphate-mannose-protein mannosyltransferase